MKPSALAIILLGFCASFGSAQEPAAALSTSAVRLEDVLLRARDNNPDIRAARQAWQVKRADIRPAGVWPDPMLTYINEKFPSGVEGVPAEKIDHYRIEQGIPFPGKLTADARMKFHESQIAEAQYRAKTIDVLNEVRLQYYKLYLTDQNIQLAQASVDILRNALRVAQTRLAGAPGPASKQTPPVGMGGMQNGLPPNSSMPADRSIGDVFMAQAELRKMENMLFEQEQQRKLVQIELNTLLNQPTEQEWGAAELPALVEIPIPLAELDKLATRNSPLYHQAMHEANHSRAMVARARLGYAPDFGVMYEIEKPAAGASGRQIGASVALPLWFSRPQGQYRSAQEHLQEAEATSQGMKNMVMKMVHMEFVETNTHLQLSRNYQEGVLPATQSSVRISKDLYATSRGDFIRLIEAFRGWIDANTAYQEQLYHYAEHWSELERWVGIDLSQAKQAFEQLETVPQEMTHDR